VIENSQSAKSPLEAAITRGDIDAVRNLLVGGADPSFAIGADGRTPLHLAADQAELGAAIARLLIASGANIEAVTSEGAVTPLHKAAFAGNADLMRVLVQAGANVSAEDSLNRTPLHCAADAGRIDAIEALLDLGVDVNQLVPGRDFTALMCAAYSGRADVCQLLLDRGADVHMNARQTGTALHMAAHRGHVDACRVLVARGAIPERVEDLLWGKRRSACQVAVQEKEVELVKFFLFECGCDPFVLTAEGKSLLDLGADGLLTMQVVLAAQSQTFIEQSVAGRSEDAGSRGVSSAIPSSSRAERSAPSL
jgi:ankyrin repeat protein